MTECEYEIFDMIQTVEEAVISEQQRRMKKKKI